MLLSLFFLYGVCRQPAALECGDKTVAYAKCWRLSASVHSGPHVRPSIDEYDVQHKPGGAVVHVTSQRFLLGVLILVLPFCSDECQTERINEGTGIPNF